MTHMDYLKIQKLKSPIQNVYCIQIITFCQAKISKLISFSLTKFRLLFNGLAGEYKRDEFSGKCENKDS
jgi:hypothetical protein